MKYTYRFLFLDSIIDEFIEIHLKDKPVGIVNIVMNYNVGASKEKWKIKIVFLTDYGIGRITISCKTMKLN